MLKELLQIILYHLYNIAYSWLGFVDTCFFNFYIKVDVFSILVVSHTTVSILFVSLVSLLLYKLYAFVSAVFYGLLLYYSILKNSTILVFLSLCIKSFIIFIVIVSIRIATPRFKIESLTKIGWLYCLLFILVCLLMYVSGYFFF